MEIIANVIAFLVLASPFAYIAAALREDYNTTGGR
jgi:hypothetical protein